MTNTQQAPAAGRGPAGPASRGERLANWADGRVGLFSLAKANLRKIFPDHWSFMLGEVALYSFLIIILTGVFLTFFFKPGMDEVVYHGRYTPLNGILMSQAYKSTLDISFDVRGGLLIRQLHHWAALVFIMAMLVHMMRVFFTGAFRKPRELNWLFGAGLLILGMFDGFMGYSLPDDLLSGTGIRFMEGAILSVPIVGTYLVFFLFGGEYPGSIWIPRLFTVHVLLIPGIMVALLALHLLLVFYHKHTQGYGPGRSNRNVVGMPLMPVYMAKAGGFFFLVGGILAIFSAIAQINPIWAYGPYRPDQVTTDAQPDWYMGYSEGLIRVMPGWEINFLGHTLVLGVFIPLLVFPAILLALWLYPFFEAWLTGDKGEHHIAERPRNNPMRTAFGAAWVAEYLLLLVGGGNDLFATRFHLSINAITWTVRVGFFVLPVLVFVATKRICMGLQRRDRDKILHGRETGVITRAPHGEYFEIHEPLVQADLYSLTAHDQPRPAELPPATDEHGTRRPTTWTERVRTRLAAAWFGPGGQVPKPTPDEYRHAVEAHHGPGAGHHAHTEQPVGEARH
ncbi:cytochrome bc1 complex cytochrome b subunit [Streptomyces mashuensis]|uniref:Cytochrome bc1 complex cytochrome b subunit n=1 Tax=Streptomyces mashuensis TaxID=33904 RepID=A0A919B3X6_9ACTN|nr:cytochrome b N-terminal domain-containing protein [Streptomyces mashuensis]GHF44265.1 cytochrome bc1 complex cytochrome b subunit [Streptomyces mashuensis]